MDSLDPGPRIDRGEVVENWRNASFERRVGSDFDGIFPVTNAAPFPLYFPPNDYIQLTDCRSFGGHAGASARIENYLGFPTGITGMALMGRAYSQAQKFGAEMAIPDEVIGLQAAKPPGTGNFVLKLSNRQHRFVFVKSTISAFAAAPQERP